MKNKYEGSVHYPTPSIRNFTDHIKPQEHQHQFNIPVEWNYIPEQTSITYSNDDYGTRFLDLDKPFKRVVTKLKCTGCSEEVER